MTHDNDRQRIEDKAHSIRVGLVELERLAVAAASRHDHQVDLLKKKAEQLQADVDEANRRIFAAATVGREGDAEVDRQIAALKADMAEDFRRIGHAADIILQGVDEATDVVDMTVGLDDIRELLAEAGQDNPAIGALLVDDGDEVQVVDSLHAILADLAMLTDAVRNGRVIAAEAQAARDRAIQAAADNAAAEADAAAGLAQDLQTAVDGLVAAVAPINRPSAKLARLSNPIGALRIVTEVVEDVARQILDGHQGQCAKALAMALTDADQLEEQISAIEAACEAGGMAATVERRAIPAWLASNLTTRAEKVKARKANATGPNDEPAALAGPWVIMRNDANGRRWFFDVVTGSHTAWGRLLSAAGHYDMAEHAETHKPRGSKVITLLEAQRLVDNDARIAAAAQPSLPATEVNDG